ncbi:MAG: glycosyltransferase family 2 protein [Bacilli bacterium]|nr:glycosyltransferase family 2 protein [Bacilli bacterium]
MSDIKIAAMTTLYNPTNDNINNIFNYIDEVNKLYVIDNTENKSNKDIIKTNDKIEYISDKTNYGIAKAINIAAEKAIKDGYKYLLTMDQDSKMTNEILKQMKDFLKQTKIKNIGLISPYQDIDSNDEIPDEECTDVIEMMTSGNIIDLEVYKKIGGFKDWLFIDCVDTEYCMNLHAHGYKVLRLNKIIMKHDLGELKVHKLFNKEYPCYNHSPIRRYYIVRNNLYINEMYKNHFPEYCKHLIRVQKGQVKRIIAFENNKIKKLKMMLKGYFDFKHGIKGKYKEGEK